jgi:peptidoglycan hydrolase-like protein with peptidoglycan-binding domain
MGKAITLGLVCGLAGAVIAYGIVSRSTPHQRPATQQDGAMPGNKEAGTLLAAASGAWRVIPSPARPSTAERISTAEVAIVPAARVPLLAQKLTSLPGDQGSLAENLQRELARVGCYDGQINGVWTTSTRQAMKAFLQRVNATLPIHHAGTMATSAVDMRSAVEGLAGLRMTCHAPDAAASKVPASLFPGTAARAPSSRRS